jgi:hypothetical protein
MVNGRALVKRVVLRALLGLVFIVCAAYLSDFLVLRWKYFGKHNPTGTVIVKPYFAVPRKDGRTEFMFDDPKEQTCVHSLFPHSGFSPCWYLSRHKEKRIDI